MNAIAAALMAVTAVGLAAGAAYLIVMWASRPVFAAAEQVGVALGVMTLIVAIFVGFAARALWRDQRWGWIAAVVIAVGLGFLAFILWTTPGPPPLPLPVTALMSLLAVALIALSGLRAVTR